MSEEALIQHILANPQDDAARLVYADWLEERSDPRAEFMRTEVNLARAAPDSAEQIALEVRLHELRRTLGTRWAVEMDRHAVPALRIEEIFQIPGKGTVVTGVVECDQLVSGNELLLLGEDLLGHCVVWGVETWYNPRHKTLKGMPAGILLGRTKDLPFAPGMMLYRARLRVRQAAVRRFRQQSSERRRYRLTDLWEGITSFLKGTK
jgi:uncharacterized protein (TIGR02996 family)